MPIESENKMAKWKRMAECPVCGEARCKETEWIVYCYRYAKGYNKKQLAIIGLGIPKDLVLRRGVIEGRSPSNQKALGFEKDQTPYDYGL